MPTHQVNLDSLIRREPFPKNDTFSGKNPHFKLEELQRNRTYFQVLRKPDFQRDTTNWSPTIIWEFVKTFLDGGLIPSVIMWHSKNTNTVFVIDGAHRMSALIAYVNDDYGGGEISSAAWGQAVPASQQLFHKKTKELIDNSLGSFQQLLAFGLDSTLTSDPEKKRRAAALSTMSLHIQTVDGDTDLAEESFYKINSSSVAIDNTELDMIRARKKPNALATRALISAGKGHKYWEDLPNSAQIEAEGANVHKILFGESLEIGPTSPDIPRAGQPYSNEAFKMVLDLVNILNNVTPAMWVRMKAKSPKTTIAVPRLQDDIDGSKTLSYLQRVSTTAKISMGDPSVGGSLGIDPGVYAYGVTGKVIPAAYIGSLTFLEELSNSNKLVLFSVWRAKFEDFLIGHKIFLNALTHSKGSRTRSLDSIVKMYRLIFNSLASGVSSDEEIIKTLQSDPQLKSLQDPKLDEQDIEPIRKRFSATVTRAKAVAQIVATRERCGICEARLPPYARSKDHIKKQEDGGDGQEANLRFTHPYCNNSRDAIEALQKEILEGANVK